MADLLKVEQLGRTMPDEPGGNILDQVSLTVAEGEFITIMGPSGSGKSTLLHCLSGLDRPDRGEVFLGGKNLFAQSEKERTLQRRQMIGFVFQFFNLLPDLTVRENLILPLLIAGENPDRHQQRITSLLESLALDKLTQRRPHALSGGEMQRVSIARALSCRPPLIMADEPTGNLSTGAGAETMKLLRTISDDYGTAVLLVTHNPRDAAFGDRVMFLKDGQLDPGNTLKGPGLDGTQVFSRLEELGI